MIHKDGILHSIILFIITAIVTIVWQQLNANNYTNVMLFLGWFSTWILSIIIYMYVFTRKD